MNEPVAKYTANVGMSVGTVQFELIPDRKALTLRDDVLADIASEVGCAIAAALNCQVTVGVGTMAYIIVKEEI